MHFSLIDRIETLEPGKLIVAKKSLTMTEDYLQDHFPHFPVMPGVLMLEAMTQSAAWLIRVSENFVHSMVIFQEARGIKYGRFLQPGQTLHLTLQWQKQDERLTTFKAEGAVEGQPSLRGQITLARYNIRDNDPDKANTDIKVINKLKERLRLIWDGPIA